ncbi:MAG: amino acid permease [Bacteroidia bacterium]
MRFWRKKPIPQGTPTQLRRLLSVWDLTAIGIAAIVGAGIFSTIGTAAAKAGPSVIFLFLIAAIVAAFSALAYAEMASSIPFSGSAYTYAYTTFGEGIAWILGWTLILEYAIGNIAVAISWSSYFSAFLKIWDIRLPAYLQIDFYSAYQAAHQTSPTPTPALTAWQTAPRIGNFPIILNLPALGIVALIAWIAHRGIRESKIANNLMVLLKISIILLVIGLGAYYAKPEKWQPFFPNGFAGMMQGIGAVFFAYIGFDALSTTAEEARNPKRDLPAAMILSLGICTLLYISIALVLTGNISFDQLAVGDPMAYLITALPLPSTGKKIFTLIVALGAVVAMASVLLVFQIGQPRIWFAMSRDGLLPPIFSRVHPAYKTPTFSNLIAALLAGVPLLFANLEWVVDLTSIGTLFAFSVVSAGVIYLHHTRPPAHQPRFRLPYIPSRWLYPLIIGGVGFFSYLTAPSLWHLKWSQIPLHYIVFLLLLVILLVLSTWYNLSLIPLLGLTTTLYLIAELNVANWIRLLVWMLIGMAVYIAYGRHNANPVENP